MLMLMAIYDPPPPEWLRGLTRIEDLPRIRQGTIHDYVVPHPLVPHREMALRAKWVVENGSGPWSMLPQGFTFQTYVDAAYFRLRWD